MVFDCVSVFLCFIVLFLVLLVGVVIVLVV